MKTLEELLNETGELDIKSAIKPLSSKLKDQESNEIGSFVESIVSSNKQVIEAIKEQSGLIRKLIERPDPKFPEPLPFPEQKEVKFPEYPAFPEIKDISPLLEELIERIGNEHTATRGVIIDLLNKESEPVEAVKDPKQVGSGIGSIRRRARWEIATYPNLPGTANITAKGDGFTFYLPSGCIPQSETIRLNGGLPMSHGIDYSLTGNNLTFIQNQTGAQIEVRYQT